MSANAHTMKSADRKSNMRESDFVSSLANGLSIILSFGRDREELTIADIARATGLSRARARRSIMTLEELGYAERRGRLFRLTAQTLNLGFPLFASIGLGEAARPYLRKVRDRVGLSCSLSVLDDKEIAFVAHESSRCVMSATVGIGARLPAFATAAGRVLLSGHSDWFVMQLLMEVELPAYTKWTQCDAKKLMGLIKNAREDGFCVVKHELEEGLVSVAVPVIDSSGRPIAAVNVSTHAERQKGSFIAEELLPLIQEAAAEISRTVT